MIEQVSNAITFAAFFVASGIGAGGLTVTVDVYRDTTAVVTAGSATEIGGGLYKYTLASGSVTTETSYYAIFKTSGTADQQHLPALWTVGVAGVEDLDAAITSRMATFTVPTNFSALAITGGGSVTTGTLSDKTGISLASSVRVVLAGSQPDYAPAKAGEAMTLTTGERDAIAVRVESHIIDETDSEQVLKAITDKIAAVNPTLGDLSLAAIASAVWNSGTRALTDKAGFGLATGAITSATFAADSITSSALAAGAVTEIQSGLFLAGSYIAPATPGNVTTAQAAIIAALPVDYQQRGVAVSLPNPAPSGYGASLGDIELSALTDEQAAQLLAIYHALATATIQVQQPVTSTGQILITAGDDYAAADSRAFALTVPSWLDLTAGSMLFKFGALSVEVEILSAHAIRWELTSVQTAPLAAAGSGRYYLVATLASGRKVTLKGDALVQKGAA